ncbi:MAG: nif-specific transcriptional activator NifA [Spirochaetales bacterium]|nr:nif-specific transcriptional activator NifA [Spirochaetales bacterium]
MENYKDIHYRRKIKELALLSKISRILDQSIELNKVINPVLEAIAEELEMQKGMITLLNNESGEITIEAAYELSDNQIKKGRYKIGEGITGRVIETGKADITPDISKSSLFLDRTEARKGLSDKQISFICVPITMGKLVFGALSAFRIYIDDINLQEDAQFLSIIASMIAQAVKLRQTIQQEKSLLVKENTRLQQELKDRFQPANIIGNSTTMQDVFDLMGQVCKSDATVLILGESGTGKELIANSIHYNSLRAGKPFIKVNCAALPETVIESELFGHEKGAFTGAVNERKGRFELADGGTIFLDEIGDLSQTMQVKLLRVLQEREIERVGGNKTIHINVRVLAATNVNLEEKMARNLFREDLYYRLNVFPIHVPPLRERKSDITLLADYFTEKYSAKNSKSIKRISSPAIELLTSYHWPGNIRELENCIERAVLLSSDKVIHAHHLPPTLQSAESTDTGLHGTLDETLANIEKEIIRDTLKTTKGNMAKAARMLGITERIMGLRVKKYLIDLNKYSP